MTRHFIDNLFITLVLSFICSTSFLTVYTKYLHSRYCESVASLSVLIHVILTRIPGLLHNESGQSSTRVPAKLSVKRHSPLHFLCFSIFINNFADDCTSGYYIENEVYTICIFSSRIKPQTSIILQHSQITWSVFSSSIKKSLSIWQSKYENYSQV